MWVSDDGRLNTVALPEPSDTMTEAFRLSLDALVQVDPHPLEELIDDAEDGAYRGDWSELGWSDQFVCAAPPVGLLHGELNSVIDLADALAQVEPRWRLDAILAVSDYLDRDELGQMKTL